MINLFFKLTFRLYLNHRPYKELEMVKIENSFERIKNYLQNEPNSVNEKGVKSEAFANLLKNYGEVMKDEEIEDIIKILKGDRSLPESISFQYLFEDLLKFEAVDSKDGNTEN